MNTTFEIKTVSHLGEIEQCGEMVAQLRPNLNQEKWHRTIQKMMLAEKYKIVGLFNHGKIIAFAGFREMSSMQAGNIIYIDDLCTSESYRSTEIANKLLSFVNEIAVAANKDAIVLNTGFSNITAHKLRLNHSAKLLAFYLAYHIKL